jgi:hypothetical protein
MILWPGGSRDHLADRTPVITGKKVKRNRDRLAKCEVKANGTGNEDQRGKNTTEKKVLGRAFTFQFRRACLSAGRLTICSSPMWSISPGPVRLHFLNSGSSFFLIRRILALDFSEF